MGLWPGSGAAPCVVVGDAVREAAPDVLRPTLEVRLEVAQLSQPVVGHAAISLEVIADLKCTVRGYTQRPEQIIACRVRCDVHAEPAAEDLRLIDMY